MKFTLDSNILLYAVDLDSPAKHDLAGDILLRVRPSDMFLCTQVLGEFMAVVRRKQPAITQEALKLVERWSLLFPVRRTGPEHIIAGGRIAAEHRLQYWDSVIIAVAAEHGARILLSEDMQDGATIEGVTIFNPFNAGNAARLQALLGE